MRPIFQSRTAILFLGDIVVFSAAVWMSLVIRAFDLPNTAVLQRYVIAFTFLFAIWALVFVVAGLYENRILVYRRLQAPRLAIAHGINVILAALVFFLVPEFGIAPKTILAIYLLVSIVLVFAWRLFLFPRVFGLPTQNVLIVGESAELAEIEKALRETGIFEIERLEAQFLVTTAEFISEMNRRASVQALDLVILDVDHPAVAVAWPDLYEPLAQGVSFVDATEAYEDVFGRVPLALIPDRWVVHNLSRHHLYDGLKRAFDIVVAGAALLCSLLIFPLIALAIRIETRGPVFIAQGRVGQYDRVVWLFKFRSMERNDVSLSKDGPPNRVTRVGTILRKSRLDELPQLFNVLRGDLSLIGPRPELPAGVAIYATEIPHYKIRHLIKPGLSGWAQLYHDAHPHHAMDIQATREKLSYDLYYVKHRSLAVDVLVGLKTIRKLLSGSGA